MLSSSMKLLEERYQGLHATLTRLEDERGVSWVLVIVDYANLRAEVARIDAVNFHGRAVLASREEMVRQGA